jgi:hypothetical protein
MTALTRVPGKNRPKFNSMRVMRYAVSSPLVFAQSH